LEELPKLRDTIKTLREDNVKADTIAAKREQPIEGLAQTVISQNKVLQVDVMGSGYALVVPQLPHGGTSHVYELEVFNHAKSNLYDFHFEVVEAINPNDSHAATFGKINATERCFVGMLSPLTATQSNCTLSVPESGGEYFMTLYDRRGKLLIEQWVFQKDPSGRLTLSYKFFNPAGIEMRPSDLIPQ
jgi:hypothetical protein